VKYWQDHPKLATAIVILIGVGATLFLLFLSRSADTNTKQSILAHGNDGPVVAAGDNYTANQDVLGIDFEDELSLGDGQTIKSTEPSDINGDGAIEAVVVVSDPGEKGQVDWYVYGLRDGKPVSLFESRKQIAQGRIRIEGPRVVEDEGVYAPGDAACCPSSFQRIYYTWQGDKLVGSQPQGVPPGTSP
jgi:hypothetical protein